MGLGDISQRVLNVVIENRLACYSFEYELSSSSLSYLYIVKCRELHIETAANDSMSSACTRLNKQGGLLEVY